MWYFQLDNRENGPADAQAIKNLLAERKINGDTLVWEEGMSDWRRLADTELVSLLAAVPPPVKPVAPVPPALSQQSAPQPKKRGCLRVFLITLGVLFGLFVLLVIIESLSMSPPSEEKPKTSAVDDTPHPPLSASVSDNISEKLVGITDEEAFEYGRLIAHAMFDDIKAKTGMDQQIRSAFPSDVDSGDEQLITERATSAGVSSAVLDRYFGGWRAGSQEIRNGQ